MKLIELLEAINFDNVESDEKIQILHPGENWTSYDEFIEALNLAVEKMKEVK